MTNKFFNKQILKIGGLFFLVLYGIESISDLIHLGFDNFKLDSIGAPFLIMKVIIMIITTFISYFFFNKEWLKWGTFTILYFITINIIFAVGFSTNTPEHENQLIYFIPLSNHRFISILELGSPILDLILQIDNLHDTSSIYLQGETEGNIIVLKKAIPVFYLISMFIPFLVQTLILWMITKFFSKTKKEYDFISLKDNHNILDSNIIN